MDLHEGRKIVFWFNSKCTTEILLLEIGPRKRTSSQKLESQIQFSREPHTDISTASHSMNSR